MTQVEKLQSLKRKWEGMNGQVRELREQILEMKREANEHRRTRPGRWGQPYHADDPETQAWQKRTEKFEAEIKALETEMAVLHDRARVASDVFEKCRVYLGVALEDRRLVQVENGLAVYPEGFINRFA